MSRDGLEVYRIVRHCRLVCLSFCLQFICQRHRVSSSIYIYWNITSAYITFQLNVVSVHLWARDLCSECSSRTLGLPQVAWASDDFRKGLVRYPICWQGISIVSSSIFMIFLSLGSSCSPYTPWILVRRLWQPISLQNCGVHRLRHSDLRHKV